MIIWLHCQLGSQMLNEETYTWFLINTFPDILMYMQTKLQRIHCNNYFPQLNAITFVLLNRWTSGRNVTFCPLNLCNVGIVPTKQNHPLMYTYYFILYSVYCYTFCPHLWSFTQHVVYDVYDYMASCFNTNCNTTVFSQSFISTSRYDSLTRVCLCTSILVISYSYGVLNT